MSNDLLLSILQKSRDATGIYTTKQLLIQFANDSLLKLWGKDVSIIGMPLEKALPELEGQPFIKILEDVWDTGQVYKATDTLATLKIDGINVTSYFDFIYEPLKDSSGEVYCILHTTEDVTERFHAIELAKEKQRKEQEIKEELDALNEEYLAANEELTALNEEYQSTNEELAAVNEEYIVTNEQLQQAKDSISSLYHELAKSNADLSASNSDYKNLYEQLDQSVRGLKERNLELKISNDTVTDLNKQLGDKEEHLQNILNTMAEGVGVIDLDGNLVYANPRAQEILGLTLSEIEDRTYDDPRWQNLRLDGSPLPQHEHPMYIMMSTGKPVYDDEIGVQPSDGRDRFYISINAAPVFDAEGKLTGGIGTFMDVTARRLIAIGKDDFISIASHELKTPVTSLKASLQILQKSHDTLAPISREKLINKSIKSLDSLSRLIINLLDTGRMNMGQVQLEKSVFTIGELFDECCSNIVESARPKLELQFDQDLQLTADKQQIGQVVVNFINNALKYAPNSESIIIGAKKVEKNIEVSVRDFGPGIPSEKLSHLFERYYRTDYKGQKFSGLGLGLYISAEIIKSHDGYIGVDSEIGSGSKFWFTIPLI